LLRRFAAAGKGVKHLKIEILNGTGVNALAAEWQERLKEKGYYIIGTANASRADYGKSVIINHAGVNHSRLSALEKLVNAEIRPGGERVDDQAQLTIVLGMDLVPVEAGENEPDIESQSGE
jgi:hypothetical protein